MSGGGGRVAHVTSLIKGGMGGGGVGWFLFFFFQAEDGIRDISV